MGNLPQQSLTVEDGKKKLVYSADVVGVSAFTSSFVYYCIYMGILLFGLITSIAFHEWLISIVISVIMGVVTWVYFKHYDNLKELIRDPDTFPAFLPPNQMLLGYKYSHPASDNLHKAIELNEDTRLGQPEFNKRKEGVIESGVIEKQE